MHHSAPRFLRFRIDSVGAISPASKYFRGSQLVRRNPSGAMMRACRNSSSRCPLHFSTRRASRNSWCRSTALPRLASTSTALARCARPNHRPAPHPNARRHFTFNSRTRRERLNRDGNARTVRQSCAVDGALVIDIEFGRNLASASIGVDATIARCNEKGAQCPQLGNRSDVVDGVGRDRNGNWIIIAVVPTAPCSDCSPRASQNWAPGKARWAAASSIMQDMAASRAGVKVL